MLISLKIQNIALIPQVEIEFGPNFNVLTGETGAGKSIILGSLNFILGDKLNKGMIRNGETRAQVDAVFEVDNESAAKINDLCGVDVDDNVLIISRSLKIDGKTDCRINGSQITASTLKEIANSLIHIHGQHDTEAVLRVKNHLNILDGYGGEEVRIPLSIYKKEYENWKSLEGKLRGLGGDEATRERQIDLYNFQINEIESADLTEGEDEELQAKKVAFQNFSKIADGLSGAIGFLSGDDGGAISALKNALSSLGSVSNFDVRLEKVYDEATNLQYALADVEGELTNYFDSMEMDEEEFARVDARLDEIKSLKRKYGTNISDILVYLENTRRDLNKLLSNEQEVEKIKQEIGGSLARLGQYAEVLSVKRSEVASDLEKKIIEQLGELEMKSTNFKVEFKGKNIYYATQDTTTYGSVSDNITQNSNKMDKPPFKPDGIDEIEFLFSANQGEPLRPLASIISGGEMSRFMLALKTLIAGNEKIGTMIFDEIDTGIGGTMGTKIGIKMSELSHHSQVICVTHLAQVASKANTHFMIKKTEKDARTATMVYPLNDDERLQEVARMIGGGGSAVDYAKTLMLQ